MSSKAESVGFGPDMICSYRRRVSYTDFTKSTSHGILDLTEAIPAGALVLGWAVNVLTAFYGDTTGVLSIGVDGDTDDFTGSTDPSVYSTGVKASCATSNDTTGAKAALSAADVVRLDIAGGADWDSVTAGVMDVYIYYLKMIPSP